jgi:hypothetical protein
MREIWDELAPSLAIGAAEFSSMAARVSATIANPDIALHRAYMIRLAEKWSDGFVAHDAEFLRKPPTRRMLLDEATAEVLDGVIYLAMADQRPRT